MLKSRDLDRFELTYIGLVVWLGLIVLATATFRGHGSPLISRYLTNYTLLVIVQGLAFSWIKPKKWADGALVLWSGIILLCLGFATVKVVKRTLVPRADLVELQSEIVRHYLSTDNPQVLHGAPIHDLPYPSPSVLTERWRHASIREFLPAKIRTAEQIAPTISILPDGIPTTSHPVIAISPRHEQTEAWRWQSDPQQDESGRFLRFKINGALGDPEAALSMRLVTQNESIEITPDGAARNRWKPINVWRPAGTWWIEIEDNDSLAHVAVTAPVELGIGSWAAGKLIKYHLWWLSLGSTLLFTGVLIALASSSDLPKSSD